MSGKKPAIPAEDVTWQTLPVLNHRIYEKYKGTDLNEAIKMFKKSHKTVTALIEKHKDDELFKKRNYQWTGTTSLGAYLISATSSHYDWGFKTIKPLKNWLNKNAIVYLRRQTKIHLNYLNFLITTHKYFI
jgi:hypothetical protein